MVSKDCQTVLMRQTPYYIGSDIKGILPTYYRLDFCNRTYSVDEVLNVIEKAKSGQMIKNSFTGNFKKKFA